MSLSNQYTQLGKNELSIAFPSIIIGVAILSLPNEIAMVTSYSDGWVAILLAGIISIIFAFVAIKVAQSFPGQSFYSFTSFLLTRPIAMIISFVFIVGYILQSSYILRSTAYITQQYLFNRTPMEVLALCFLLVVVYAVSGERLGLFRLNMLFLPIIIFIFIFAGLFNIKWFEAANYQPLFKTELKGYMQGILISMTGFSGFGIGLFYIALMGRNKYKLTKKVATSIGIAILFYLFIYLSTIGIFGNLATRNLMYPTIELAKRVDLPGGVLEKSDAFIFTIWTMAIFNSIALILDIAVLLLCSMFNNLNKKITVFILSPIVFYLAMLPQQIDHVFKIYSFMGLFFVLYMICIITILFTAVKVRGVK